MNEQLNPPVAEITIADRIYDAVQQAPNMCAKEYAVLLDQSPSNIASIMTQLFRNGYLTRTKTDYDGRKGVYIWQTAKSRKPGTPLARVQVFKADRAGKPKVRKSMAVPPVDTTAPTATPLTVSSTPAVPEWATRSSRPLGTVSTVREAAAPNGVQIMVNGQTVDVETARRIWSDLNKLFG